MRQARDGEPAAELETVCRQLAKRDEDYAALIEAHAKLLLQRANRYARHEAVFRAELARQAERCLLLEAQLVTATKELLAQQAEVNALRGLVAATDQQLRAVLASSSWRLSAPLRSTAARHPAMRRMLAGSVRGAWRILAPRLLHGPRQAVSDSPLEPSTSLRQK